VRRPAASYVFAASSPIGSIDLETRHAASYWVSVTFDRASVTYRTCPVLNRSIVVTASE
jgi:hypothetical protein